MAERDAPADPNATLQRLQDGLTQFGTDHDPGFVRVLLSARGAVIYRSTAPTDELAARYAVVLEGTGRPDLEFRTAVMTEADRARAATIVTRAADGLRELGVTVWSIRHGRPDEPVVVCYEDPDDHGIPAPLRAELDPFPAGTVEFRRVTGPTTVGIAHRFRR